MAAALSLSKGEPITKGVVFQWKVRGRVPADWCPEVEKLTGVPCEELNDKVDWAYVRSNKSLEPPRRRSTDKVSA